ncbi:MAG: LptF/LptG family permease [Akkermansiaceae bacterium]
MNLTRNHLKRFLLPLVLAALGAGFCALLVPAEIEAVRQQLIGFPDSDVAAHQARPLVLAALFLLPALAALFYALADTMDRYIASEFAGIFGVCLSALVMIWLLIDLGDKIGDFREAEQVLRTIGLFYGTRAPAILLLLLPYSLLLALLYSLGKLSGSREIIAMIQSGRSVIRVTLPLLVAGIFLSLFSLGLNYHWGPVSEGLRGEILEASSGKKPIQASNVLFRDPSNRRLWLIGEFPRDYHTGGPLRDVQITTTRADNSLESRISASSARWDPGDARWTFENAVVGEFRPNEPTLFKSHTEPLIIEGWAETPWQLIKPGLSPALLGIPDLSGWLAAHAKRAPFTDPAPYQTQWHFRWALPFTCLVTVLLATPLGIHFARRGAGGGVFFAVALAGLMLLFSTISVALGEAGALAPWQAAWLPNASFALLGLYLFRRRITGQPIYRALTRLLPTTD